MPSIATLLGGSQNKAWAEDKSGFGYRMMNKMGWTEGKGLGKDEAGMVTHVKLKKRTEELGLGSEVSDLKNKKFIDQQNDYNALLASLAKEHGTVEAHKKKRKRREEEEKEESDEEEDGSEEEQAKPSRQRRPLKFQRGRVLLNKDVSRYTAEEKAALFGISDKGPTLEEILNGHLREGSITSSLVVEVKEETSEKEIWSEIADISTSSGSEKKKKKDKKKRSKGDEASL